LSRYVALFVIIAAFTFIGGVAEARTFTCTKTNCEGSARADEIVGTAASDSIKGRDGGDTIYTHTVGLETDDADELLGQNGADSLYANDGDDNDLLNCGRGLDAAFADTDDVIRNCETVTRFDTDEEEEPPPPPPDECPAGSTNVTTTPSNPLTPSDGSPDDVNLQAQITNSISGTTLCFPSGTYDFSGQVDVRKNGLTLLGLDGATLKRSPSSAADMMFRFIRASNTLVTGFDIDGGAAGDTWVEHGIVFTVYTSHNSDFTNNTFSNVMGDGVYYGRTSDDTTNTCNTEVDVTNNAFTGTNQSRNAISVICGNDINVSGNSITRWSRADMPGCIDLEPNEVTERLDNVIVNNNLCDNMGGVRLKWGGITSALSQHGARSSNVTISNNEVRGVIGQGIAVDTHLNDSWTVNNNNVHDVDGGGPGAWAMGFFNYGPNVYTNNTVSNISAGGGYCLFSSGGSPTITGNTFSGCD
jgi:hypothetical protein